MNTRIRTRAILAFAFSSVLLVGAAPLVFDVATPTRAGQIQGIVQTCDAVGTSGMWVYIPGKSLQAKLGTSGEFSLFYVPEGTYTLMIEREGHVLHSVAGVVVQRRELTDLGVLPICPDLDADGFNLGVDCNDLNAMVHPGALELCDGLDNDCDGIVDEGCPTCTDADSDGFFAQLGCGTPVDCDDHDAAVHLFAVEACDGIDNDCDGFVDEGFDADGDGWTICEGDCNDGNPAVHPGALEVCDGVDNDCNGVIDESFDLDGDGWSPCDGDCAEGDPSVNPGAAEICGNNTDDDCDGFVDEFVPGNVEICGNGVDDDCDGDIDEPGCVPG